MKFFTNRGVTKKIVIVILTVLLLTFAVPKPVNAAGGILLGPLTALCTTLVDSLQHILERFMLGEWNSFMKNIDDKSSYNSQEGGAATVDLDKEGIEIGGAWWGDVTGTEIPVIQYTPEEIFSNRVPALDVNFIKPSVTTGNTTWDNEHNIAMKLRPTIASWYVAMRTLALVGLLSVLVYLGIRMLLTSVAADKAKYKKMMMDWVVAICLLFALHYIMSFALTMSEVVTSMIANTSTGTITVKFGEHTFTGNLMSYVRFMIQAKDTSTSLGFFFLYIMLMIYTVKFTWVYLKRVVNMAFLTLIAPLVALTYPIDKVSDAKAQAFELWVKEFAFNALLQPLHLLLYIVLLGSATELVAVNPLYAVVCLGFITAGEKLFKKMFGFDKAGAGTVGSLAGAAGVSALAHSALMKLGKGQNGGKGGPPGKVKYKREGKDGSPKGYSGQGVNLENVGGEAQAQNTEHTQNHEEDNKEEGQQLPSGGNEQQQMSIDDQIAQERANMSVQDYRESGMSPQEWEANRREELEAERANNHREQQDGTDMPEEQFPQGTPEVQEAMRNLGPESHKEPEPEGLFGKDGKPGMLRTDWIQAKNWAQNKRKDVFEGIKKLGDAETYKNAGKRIITGVKKLPSNANIAAGKGYKRFKAVAPALTKKAIRGGLKTGARVLGGVALGATAGLVGMTDDLDTGLKWGLGGFTAGALTGGSVFENTAGKRMADRSTKEILGAAKYGSVTDYKNAMADKEYFRNGGEFDEFFEKNYKNKTKREKQEIKNAYLSYRQAGITDNKIIKKALALEDTYVGRGANREQTRQDMQRVIQTHDQVSTKSYKGDEKAKKADIEMIERDILDIQDKKLKRERAQAIFKMHQDFYET